MNKVYLIKVISTLINFSLSIVLGVIVPKAIGPMAYGEYSYVVATYAFLFQFLMFTSGSAYIYFLSISKYSKGQINTFYMLFLSGVTLTVVILSCLSVHTELGFQLFWNEISNKSLIYLGLVFGCFTNAQQRLFEYCDSTNQSIVADKLKIISKALMALSILLLIFFDVLNVYILMFVSILNIVFFLILFYYKINFKFGSATLTVFKKIKTDFYLYLQPLFFFSVTSAVYAYLGKFLLQESGGSIEQGYYNFSLQLSLIPVTLLASVMAIYMSDMTKKYQCNDVDGVSKIFSDNIFKVYCVHACISLYLLINATDIVLFVVGESFAGAIESLEILSIFSLCHTFGMLSGNLFLSTGRNKLYSSINVLVMLFGGLFLISTSYFITMNAMALSIIVTSFYALRVSIQLYFSLAFFKLNKIEFVYELMVVFCVILISFSLVNFFRLDLFVNLFLSMLSLVVVNFMFKDYLGLRTLFFSFRRLISS